MDWNSLKTLKSLSLLFNIEAISFDYHGLIYVKNIPNLDVLGKESFKQLESG